MSLLGVMRGVVTGVRSGTPASTVQLPGPGPEELTKVLGYLKSKDVAQIEDQRRSEAISSGAYLEATKAVLREHGGLWFWDESFVISRKRDSG